MFIQMYVSDQKIKEGIKLFREHKPMLRTSEVLEVEIHNRTLYYMLEEGHITKLERGHYKLADEGTLSNPSLTIVAKKVPKVRLYLISVLYFHELTTAISHHVYIALPKTSRDPMLSYPPLQTYRFSGQSLTEGVQAHEVDGVEIKAYNPAKTIADCFKFRNQIGLDIAIEALKVE
ncbi:MAG TPA: type IV toxin-antitoxin system AbiEi family antitoxin domain-containing protein [Fodinibius sp.]|nr:type IV toxin-antitoxin system AbiEi family antitoxin domain-containing protein [Fodinibius sp.]